MNQISIMTRRDIFDSIQLESIAWSGRLEEVEFLSRIYDLKNIRSDDSRFSNAERDIWQHRVNNYDWEDYWIFTDDRFNLLSCTDLVFIRFLCEMIHPIVRRTEEENNKLLEIFNTNLIIDGFEIFETNKVSNRPVFDGRMKVISNMAVKERGKSIEKIFNADYVSQQLHLMQSSIEVQPYIAIGIAKELIETACKSIFVGREKDYDKNWDLSKLMKETTKLLQLTPNNIDDEARAAKSIRQILGSLASIVQGIAEVRNEYGSGHGKSSDFKGLQPRHAKLAVGAATTLVEYLLETHELRQVDVNMSSTSSTN